MTTQSRRQWVQAVVVRELVTVARSRSTVVLLVGVLAVVFGAVLAGGSQPDYLPTAVDLLLPMELVVPAVAVALGYRTIAADARRGELAVLRTYRLPAWGYVVGIYVARVLALLVIVGLPLALVGLYVASLSADTSSLLATHSGVDSPIIFLRFLVLTLLFGVVVLAMALAASTLARSRRSVVVAGVVLVLAVVIGIDLLVVRGFAGGQFAGERLTTLLALSPASAYRGLVFETVLMTATDRSGQQASTVLSLFGLAAWTVGSLAVATVTVRRR